MSVAGAATLKQHVPTFGGQRWDMHSHFISPSPIRLTGKKKNIKDFMGEGQDLKMRFGREIRSVGFKERQREHAHVNYELEGPIPFSIKLVMGKLYGQTPCGSHFSFNCSMPCGPPTLHVNFSCLYLLIKIKHPPPPLNPK